MSGTPRAYGYCLLAIAVQFFGVAESSSREMDVCSTFCACDMWYGLRRASCTGRRLYSIHTGVSGEVQALDLSDNSISSLGNYELADAGVTQVRYLNLSGNAIAEIDLNAFSGLDDLSVLDLSRNHLTYLLVDTFLECKHLRVLRLAGNNFNVHVPRLRSPSLTELNMNACRISHVSPGTFDGLMQLRHLDLSDNLMIQLDGRILQRLPFMKSCTIVGNPWSCNGIMRDLQAYFRKRNISFTEVCKEAATPRKFEKMIALETPKKFKEPRPAVIEPRTKNNWNVPHPITGVHTNVSTNATSALDDVNKTTFLVPWYLIFGMGFLLGTFVGGTVTYIFASSLIGCSSLCTRRRNTDNFQRVSLLQDNWLQSNAGDDDGRETVENGGQVCPGTPPPPYRDVILHTNLYPRTSQ
ncbi:immunoglobulin superfamily member 10 [Orussus abietinus]|uniref:immunoglobulin superfamily member 10 n=1 Tax=Orussus abietinus TaxID=222816 RepID=UPI000C715C12|nr:immunoglobulin superfamily member 10 [Orussus abietinus]